MWREQVVHRLEGEAPFSMMTEDADKIDGSTATLLVRGVREGLLAPVVEDFTTRWPDLRTGVYLMDLVDGSFRTIRVTIRGPKERVAEAIPDLEEALEGIEGTEISRSEEGE